MLLPYYVLTPVFSTAEPSWRALFTNQPFLMPSQMIPPNARSKTTIGTATATARVVVETAPPEPLGFEADEVLEDAPVEVVEVCSLPSSLA